METMDLSDFQVFFEGKFLSNFKAHLAWMGYLCCKGDFLTVLQFLGKQRPDMVKRYLTEEFPEFGGGTIIHMLLLWNYSDKDTTFSAWNENEPYSGYIIMSPFDMYKALRKMGANMCAANELQNYNLELFIPCDGTNYEKRDPSKFVALYNKIIAWENQPTPEKFYDWSDPSTKTRPWDWKSDPCRCGLYGYHTDPLGDCNF